MALSSFARSERRAFTSFYGSETSRVVSRIASGWSTERIVNSLNVPETTVAAYRANVTRGTYAPFVSGDPVVGFEGSCNY